MNTDAEKKTDLDCLDRVLIRRTVRVIKWYRHRAELGDNGANALADSWQGRLVDYINSEPGEYPRSVNGFPVDENFRKHS